VGSLLLWFNPALFLLDALAPIVLAVVGVDVHIVLIDTFTALVSLYGLTYEALGELALYTQGGRAHSPPPRGWQFAYLA